VNDAALSVSARGAGTLKLATLAGEVQAGTDSWILFVRTVR
jgi:hypothetical protein